MEGLRAVEVVARGRVQRVGYRRYVLDTAQELGVAGYVKNMDDGGVKIFFQAPQDIFEQFMERLKNPPPPAVVKQLEVKEAKVKPALKGFRISYGRLQDELQEGFGAMQTVFLDYWSEFRDYRQEFRDFVGEFRDYRQEFRDFVGEFRDHRQEFRDYRQEFRDFAKRTNENFQRIMERYGEISDKLTVILETLVKESKETREMIYEMMRLLRESVEKLSQR